MTLYRKLIWYMKGLKEYTQNGYIESSKSFNPNDLNVDLSGKVCLITGANSGLGKSCAEHLSKLGAKIHMVCRDKKRGEQALHELKEHTNSDKFVLHLLDMSKPSDVYRFGKQFSENEEKLDILINNAGCMINDLTYNSDDLEMNFVTNTLSTYLLTESLIDALDRSQNSRVVVVSSGGMLLQKLDCSDMNFKKGDPKGFDGAMVYAQNKRQQVIMTTEWSKKYSKIKFFSMHPGWADTPAVASSMSSFYEKHKSRLRTVDQGSDTIVWLAASEAALSQPNGEFFQDRKVVSQHLCLAQTKSSENDIKDFMNILKNYQDKLCDGKY